jgi:GNAT superfamily N-acetyltransferase
MEYLSLNIRQAELNDLAELRDLEQCVVDAERPFNNSIKVDDVTYYDIHQLITSIDAQMLVAEDSNRIIATGYALIRKSKNWQNHEKDAYLGFMYVNPDYRGKMVNKELIDRLIAWGRSQGIVDFYLDVYAQNAAAIRAYQKAGFESSLIEMKLSTKSPFAK